MVLINNVAQHPLNVPLNNTAKKSYSYHNVFYKRKKCHLHDCFGIKYDNLNREGKKSTETARQQIQSAVLSLNTRALSLNTRGPEARDILRRMLSSVNHGVQFIFV